MGLFCHFPLSALDLYCHLTAVVNAPSIITTLLGHPFFSILLLRIVSKVENILSESLNIERLQNLVHIYFKFSSFSLTCCLLFLRRFFLCSFLNCAILCHLSVCSPFSKVLFSFLTSYSSCQNCQGRLFHEGFNDPILYILSCSDS